MDIIHLSDTHTHQDRIKIVPCDLLIHTGDFCNIDFSLVNKNENSAMAEKNKNFNQALNFLNWIDSYPSQYKIITSGNHETFLDDIELRTKFELLCSEKNIIFKDTMSEIIELEGIRIAGAGSYPVIAKYMTSKHAYFYNEGFYTQIPDKPIDILLSHVPPEVSGNQFECPDLEYWLRERIKDDMPVPLVLCGHIHEAKGSYLIKGLTRVLNSSCEFNPVTISL